MALPVSGRSELVPRHDQAVAAAARLLDSPFIGDKLGPVKFIVDNTRAVGENLAAVRSCLDAEPDCRRTRARDGDAVVEAGTPRGTG